MADLDNIIARLEHAIGPAAWRVCGGVVVNAETVQEAISLLKAQEPVSVQKKQMEMVGLKTWDWACGNCGQTVLFGSKFCQWCGRAVKWE